MTVSRRVATAVMTAGGVALAMALFAPGAAVAAEGDGPLISFDGVSFSSAPDGGIFPSRPVLVPGSTATGAFYVKNDSGRTADLQIAVADTSGTSATFIENLTLQAATRAMPAEPPVQLQSGTTCSSLLAGLPLEARTVTKVTITLAMSQTLGNVDQGSTADTNLVVSLSDHGSPAPLPNCEGGRIPVVDGSDAGPASAQPQQWQQRQEQREKQQPALVHTPRTSGETNPSPSSTDPPAVATPPTAGSPPFSSAAAQLPFAWMGIGALIAGAGAFLLELKRRRSKA